MSETYTPVEVAEQQQSRLQKLIQMAKERRSMLQPSSYTLEGIDVQPSDVPSALSRAATFFGDRLSQTEPTTQWAVNKLLSLIPAGKLGVTVEGIDATAQTRISRAPEIVRKQILRRSVHEPSLNLQELGQAHIETESFESGVVHQRLELEEGSADMCIAPEGSVPSFYLPKDVLRSLDGQLVVGASMAVVPEHVDTTDGTPLIITAGGWFSEQCLTRSDLTVFDQKTGADRDNALKEYIRDMMVSVGARRGDAHFGIDDFRAQVTGWRNEGDYNGRKYFASQEPMWLMTSNDGSYRTVGLQEVQNWKDDQWAAVESFVPSLGVVTAENMQAEELAGREVDVNAAVVFTDAAGERRIASLSGDLRANAPGIYDLAGKLIRENSAEATNVEVVLFDGGRSRGAAVNTTGTDIRTIGAYEPVQAVHEVQQFMVIKKQRE